MSCVLIVRDIGGVFVDVVLRETVEAAMEIPQHPVESGAKISDHAWRIPTSASLECISQDVTGTYESLFSVMKTAEPFTIVTGFTVLSNMLIEKLAPERDPTTGQVLKFTCSLKEVIRVSSQRTASNSANGDGNGKSGEAGVGSDERGAGRTQRGQVQANEVSPGQDLLDRLERR